MNRLTDIEAYLALNGALQIISDVAGEEVVEPGRSAMELNLQTTNAQTTVSAGESGVALSVGSYHHDNLHNQPMSVKLNLSL